MQQPRIQNARGLLSVLLSLQMINGKLHREFPEKVSDLTSHISRLIHLLKNCIHDYHIPDPTDELPSMRVNQQHVDNKSDCAFCLDQFITDSTVKQLPCQHIFHPNCLSLWLREQNSCPLCRTTVTDWERLHSEMNHVRAYVSDLLPQFIQFQPQHM